MTDNMSGYAINTYSYTLSHTVTQCFRHLAELGYRDFELMMYSGHAWPADMGQGARASLRQWINDNGLRIITLNMSFLETTDEHWCTVLGINLYGVFLCGQLAARQMVEQGTGGRIVNVASNSGIFGGRGHAAYGTSKAGLINLPQCMAIELAEHDLLINAVVPDPTQTRPELQDELAG